MNEFRQEALKLLEQFTSVKTIQNYLDKYF